MQQSKTMSEMTARYNNAAEEGQDTAQVQMRARQVRAIRYKVYIFFLALFMFIFWPTFIQSIEHIRGMGAFSVSLLNPVQSMFYGTGEGGLLSELYTIEQDLLTTEQKIKETTIEKEVVKHLSNEKKVNTLVNCVNLQLCDEVPPELMRSLGLLRTYLIINQLQTKKMKFNQKLLLRNLNEFLLRTQGGVLNGTLLSINFSEPTVVNPELSLYSLPITLKIEFDHKKMLMSFLENLENKVNLELPVLYVITSVSYDIVNYQETQVVDISLEVYFYQGEFKEEEFGTGEVVFGDTAAKTDQALLDDLRGFAEGGTGAVAAPRPQAVASGAAAVPATGSTLNGTGQ